MQDRCPPARLLSHRGQRRAPPPTSRLSHHALPSALPAVGHTRLKTEGAFTQSHTFQGDGRLAQQLQRDSTQRAFVQAVSVGQSRMVLSAWQGLREREKASKTQRSWHANRGISCVSAALSVRCRLPATRVTSRISAGCCTKERARFVCRAAALSRRDAPLASNSSQGSSQEVSR